MKKYLLLLLLVGSAVFAQHKPKFGVNLGGTYANLRNNDLNNGDESIFFGKTDTTSIFWLVFLLKYH